MRGLLVLVVLLVVLALGWQRFQGWVAANPEKVPWTPLALTDPIGPYTARKLNALAEDTPLCLALLDQADVAHSPLPPLAGDRCGYDNAVTMIAGGAMVARLQPADVGVSCPVAAALAVWEREIVRPLALKHFGSALEAIDHYGSYSCRNIAGGGNRSEHAAANALDVAGFRLEDGTRITLAADWDRPGKAEFLRGVRDGACALFGTTLSPDYNAAHADHFHLDQARRGGTFCR
jgi:hypothetical protein